MEPNTVTTPESSHTDNNSSELLAELEAKVNQLETACVGLSVDVKVLASEFARLVTDIRDLNEHKTG